MLEMSVNSPVQEDDVNAFDKVGFVHWSDEGIKGVMK